MNPLQKAKLLKELKGAINTVKSAKGLNKAKALKQVLSLREQLGFKSKKSPVNQPAYPKLEDMEATLSAANYNPVSFEDKYGASLESLGDDLLSSSASDDIVKRFEMVLDTQTQRLVDFAVASLESDLEGA